MPRLARRVVHHLKRKFIPPTQPVTALPALDMARVVERGRCAYDCYQRGSALAHGKLAEQVWNDPLFRKVLASLISRPEPGQARQRSPQFWPQPPTQEQPAGNSRASSSSTRANALCRNCWRVISFFTAMIPSRS